MSKKISLTRLRTLNLIMSGLHAAQGLLVLWLSRDFTLPINGTYLAFNPSAQKLEPTTTHLFDLSLPALIIAFFFLSSAAHLFIATVYNKKYGQDLAIGTNRARWFEYALSASVMMVAISLLVGIYDFVSLVLIFILVAIMNLLGLVMEVHNQTTKKTSWISYWIGCLAGIAPWFAIAFICGWGPTTAAKRRISCIGSSYRYSYSLAALR